MQGWEQQLLCTWLQSLSISLLRCWSWLAKQRSKGETSSAVGNSQRWRAWHFVQGNHCWRGCDLPHSKIPHQQVFKEGPKELGFWFVWIQCQKGLESSLCITKLHNLMWLSTKGAKVYTQFLSPPVFNILSWLGVGAIYKKNRTDRLIAQVYHVCTMVLMCMRGSWESHL